MKKFILKKRTSGGIRQYRAPRSGYRKTMQWSKWKTISKFNSIIEACENLKEIKDIINLIGSTEHKLTFGKETLFWLGSDFWLETKKKLDQPETIQMLKTSEKILREKGKII